MQPSDEVMAAPMRAVAARVGRPSQRALVLRDGPPVLCVLVGTPQGRWHDEVTPRAPAARQAMRMLCHAHGVTDLAQVGMDTAGILGLAVLVGWRFVHEAVGHEETYAFTLAAQGAHRRRQGVKFLEHPVLQTWPLSPEAQGSPLPDLWASMPAHALGQALLADVARLSSSASVEIVRQWEVMYGPLADAVVAWPAWAPVAKALAVGAWRADVTARFNAVTQDARATPLSCHLHARSS
jgi:hypothetical protein